MAISSWAAFPTRNKLGEGIACRVVLLPARTRTTIGAPVPEDDAIPSYPGEPIVPNCLPRPRCARTVSTPATLGLVLLLSGTNVLLAQRFEDQTAARFPAPPPNDFSNQLTIGDIDGDTDLDIIFANGGNFASAGTPESQRVYINDGSGVFTDESAARLNFTGLCRGAELGDIDGDGDLDLLLSQDFDRQPALFTNNGAGVFTDVTAGQLPTLTLSSARAQFIDIDNDGDSDIYIASGVGSRFGCGQNRILVNDGTGTFTDETAGRHPTSNWCENMDVTPGDVDGDLDVDILVGNRATNETRLLLNDGTGVFAVSATIPNNDSTYSFDFGDIDGDNDLDLLGANSRSGNSGEALWENDGTGTFSDVSGQISPNATFDDDNDSKFFDLDNDGDLDLIVAALSAGAEKIFTNDGNGNFTQASGQITAIADSSLDLMVADLNGDGRFDIVSAQGESGAFTNRIYIDTVGPADTRPPRIVDTDAALNGTTLVVRAAILDDMTSDRNFFDRGITLSYTINGGMQQTTPMRFSGGQIYRGAIESVPGGSTVRYFVTATDFAGNEVVGPEQVFSAGALFADGFESGDTSAWSMTVGPSASGGR